MVSSATIPPAKVSNLDGPLLSSTGSSGRSCLGCPAAVTTVATFATVATAAATQRLALRFTRAQPGLTPGLGVRGVAAPASGGEGAPGGTQRPTQADRLKMDRR